MSIRKRCESLSQPVTYFLFFYSLFWCLFLLWWNQTLGFPQWGQALYYWMLLASNSSFKIAISKIWLCSNFPVLYKCYRKYFEYTKKCSWMLISEVLFYTYLTEEKGVLFYLINGQCKHLTARWGASLSPEGNNEPLIFHSSFPFPWRQQSTAQPPQSATHVS